MMKIGECRWYGRYRWMSLYDRHHDGHQYTSLVWCVSTSIFDVVDIGESPCIMGIREFLWPDEYQSMSLRWKVSVSVLEIVCIDECPWYGRYLWCFHITIVSQFRTFAYVIRPTRHRLSSLRLTSKNHLRLLQHMPISSRSVFERFEHLLHAPTLQAQIAIIAAVYSFVPVPRFFRFEQTCRGVLSFISVQSTNRRKLQCG